MTRSQPLSLDGPWQFWLDPDDTLTLERLAPEAAGTIVLPAPLQAHSDPLRDYTGGAWYARDVTIPDSLLGERLFLHFGAVDHHAQVWLNGACLGEHEGGYLPFEFDISEQARAGENRLTVRVTDAPALFAELPHGKQSWYGPLSGIWQSVWLQRRAAQHLRHARIHAELGSGAVRCDLRLAEAARAGDAVRAVVRDPDGHPVAEGHAPLEEGHDTGALTLAVGDVRPWSPDSPMLYEVELTLEREGAAVDRLSERVGFRTIETRDGYLYLNGELLYLRGALDQDYYPGTICTPPSTAFLEDQLLKAKAMGLNCLRCHIKAPDPRYYEVADRLGMLIWSELPNWRTLTPASAARAWQTMEGIVERDGNHPSIIIWTLVNEDWGTELMRDPSHRAWLKQLYHRLKALDPTRLVVDNSPCEGNFHVVSDLEDYHFYRAIPDHADEWDLFVRTFAARLAPTYSPFGDAERRGDEPLILSEFGNWGLPDIERLRDETGRLPWWMESGLEWADGVAYPHDVQRRFRRWGLDRVFGRWEAFVEATQWQEFYALRHEIEAMRSHPAIGGYVITEFTDVHWEANGLLDMARNPKVFHERLREINADTLLFPVETRRAYWSGEASPLAIGVAHGGGAPFPGGTVRWRIGEGETGGELPLSPLDPATATSLGPVALQAPTVERPRADRLRLALHAPDGALVNRSEVALSVYPRELPGQTAGYRLWVGQPALAYRLRQSGYTLVEDPAQADVAITTRFDPEHRRLVGAGGRLLLLAYEAAAFTEPFMGLTIVPRRRTAWEGNWASSFAWLRRAGPFAAIPGGPLLDASCAAIAPDHVIAGLGTWDFESNVYAGLFVGWIHKVAGVVTRQPYGAGQAVVNTFRIAPALVGVDPVTTHILDALIVLTAERPL